MTTEDNVVIAIVIPKTMRSDVYNYINEKHVGMNDWLVDLIADEMHK